MDDGLAEGIDEEIVPFLQGSYGSKQITAVLKACFVITTVKDTNAMLFCGSLAKFKRKIFCKMMEMDRISAIEWRSIHNIASPVV